MDMCEHKRQTDLYGPFDGRGRKTICIDCLSFLGWKKEAQDILAPGERADTIKMLRMGELSEWESGFINSIEKRRELSEKQLQVFERIKKKYLKPSANPQPAAEVSAEELAKIF